MRMPWKKRFHNVITGKSCGTAIFTFQHIIGEKKIQFTQFLIILRLETLSSFPFSKILIQFLL